MQPKRRTLAFALMALFLPVSADVLGQQVAHPNPGSPGQWRLIGTTRASHQADHDTLIVQGPNDDFRAIKLKVTGAPLNLHRMVVTYENGEPDTIQTRYSIPQGGETRTIDLRGAGKRRIRRIDFWYDTRGLTNREAAVTIFGMK